jgi:methylmalonyl-CoA/ethylmalonyl-CoA epimerase
MRVDHVTAVVADADQAAETFRRLLGEEPVASVALPGMAIRTFRIGEAEIHLNAPTGPGPVRDHHQRHGPGVHHLALRVDDLDAALRDLRGRGFEAVGAPISTAPGLREVFLDPRGTHGLWIQLVERKAVGAAAHEIDAAAVARLADRACGG